MITDITCTSGKITTYGSFARLGTCVRNYNNIIEKETSMQREELFKEYENGTPSEMRSILFHVNSADFKYAGDEMSDFENAMRLALYREKNAGKRQSRLDSSKESKITVYVSSAITGWKTMPYILRYIAGGINCFSDQLSTENLDHNLDVRMEIIKSGHKEIFLKFEEV